MASISALAGMALIRVHRSAESSSRLLDGELGVRESFKCRNRSPPSRLEGELCIADCEGCKAGANGEVPAAVPTTSILECPGTAELGESVSLLLHRHMRVCGSFPLISPHSGGGSRKNPPGCRVRDGSLA